MNSNKARRARCITLSPIHVSKAPRPFPTFKKFVKIVGPTPDKKRTSEPQFPKWNRENHFAADVPSPTVG